MDPVGPVAAVAAAGLLDEAGGDVETPVNQTLDTKVHACK